MSGISGQKNSKQNVGNSNLYISNLPLQFTKEDLAELCSPFGELTSYVLNRRDDYCFGFVNFLFFEDAQRALNELNGSQVLFHHFTKRQPVELCVRPANISSKDLHGTPSNVLYVQNLPIIFTEYHVRRLFGEFHKPTNVKMYNPRDKPHLKALVEFATEEEATAILHKFTGYETVGSLLPLHIKYIETKAEKEERQRNTLTYDDRNEQKTLELINLPSSVTKSWIMDVFDSTIMVRTVRLFKNFADNSKIALIFFYQNTDVDMIAKKLIGLKVKKKEIRVSVLSGKVNLQQYKDLSRMSTNAVVYPQSPEKKPPIPRRRKRKKYDLKNLRSFVPGARSEASSVCSVEDSHQDNGKLESKAVEEDFQKAHAVQDSPVVNSTNFSVYQTTINPTMFLNKTGNSSKK
ncbi:hypothetical protein PCE1_001246 [Barthelona sp. PCE]